MSLAAGLAGCVGRGLPPVRRAPPHAPMVPSAAELAAIAADTAELRRRETLGEWRRRMRLAGEGHRLGRADWHWPLAYADQRRQMELAAEDGQPYGAARDKSHNSNRKENQNGPQRLLRN